jgi:S1-C subfamily serine protease
MIASALRRVPRLVLAGALALAPLAAAVAGPATPPVELRRLGARAERAPGESPSFEARPAQLPRTRGDVREVYRKVAPATVVIRTRNGHGSGVIVSPDGLVLTNHHVARDGERDGQRVKVLVETGRIGADGVMERGGEPLPAYVLKWDRRLDLAVLRLASIPAGAASIPVSPSNATPGEPVAALGHGGIGLLWAIRDCEVASVGHLYDSLARAVLAPAHADAQAHEEELRQARRSRPARVIQSTCTIAPGDSGGPLVNKAGELVGLNDFIIGDPRAPVAASFHVEGREIRAFLAQVPQEAPPLFPDPWDAGEEGALEDHDGDGRAETLVLRGEHGTAFFVGDGAEPPAGGVDGILDRRSFPAHAVIAGVGEELFAWYASGGGALDLVLAGDLETGAVKAGWRLVPTGAAEPLDPASLPPSIAAPAALKDAARAERFARVAATAFPQWAGPAGGGPAGVPDPFPAAGAQLAVSDVDADGKPEMLAWRGRAGTGVLIDPEQRVPPGDAAAVSAAFRGKAQLGFVAQSGRAWCLYDRDRDGAFDLALASGDDDGGAVREAFLLGKGAPAPAPDQVGRLIVRPGLLRVPDAAGGRVVRVFERFDLASLVGRSEGGLASFPAVLGGGWRPVSLPPPGPATAAIGLARSGAQAIVADLSGRVRKMTAPAVAKAIAAGTLPLSFAWLGTDGIEWTYYDRDGDGRLDLVLVATDPGSGRSAHAYAVEKGGAVAAAPALAEGPLFRTSVFARKERAARARELFGALGVKDKALER